MDGGSEGERRAVVGRGVRVEPLVVGKREGDGEQGLVGGVGETDAVEEEGVPSAERCLEPTGGGLEASVVEPLGGGVPLVPGEVVRDHLLLGLLGHDGTEPHQLETELVHADVDLGDDHQEAGHLMVLADASLVRGDFRVEELQLAEFVSADVEREDPPLGLDLGDKGIVSDLIAAHVILRRESQERSLEIDRGGTDVCLALVFVEGAISRACLGVVADVGDSLAAVGPRVPGKEEAPVLLLADEPRTREHGLGVVAALRGHQAMLHKLLEIEDFLEAQ